MKQFGWQVVVCSMPRCSDRKGTVTKSWSLHWRDNKRHGGRWVEVSTTFHIGCPTNALSEIWRRWSIETSECQNAETELNPFWDPRPRPMKVAEKRGDAFGAPGWEHESGGGIEDGLQPVQQQLLHWAKHIWLLLQFSAAQQFHKNMVSKIIALQK